MSFFETITLPTRGDHRGELTIVEALKNIPFEIKRIYYLKDLDCDTPRGFHAHYKLKQMAICLSGTCEMLFDDGNVKETLIMNSSSEGILIPPMVWHEMHNFSKDCIFLVLASDIYDESDYIRSYLDFIKVVSNDT
ncbi:FdtA/QdtA family cupin domain-containing protein [Pseudoalteromonas sp. NEC-BIFX-2020_002]|uniref:sugar 3,4-ketoisomerase n=1 Tax=Pseudoalteromonas sp. NEC-BIFX-2020_002 TaxID=2732353 RepID=UPI001476BABF|nr:FdtA/QdtA family cupin domain-containing protein [Pseudoalteromonas sp. NEC-BIFX-2020_002]NNG45143.1 FdtA/QdtA family cupin domain-containing protein [Pseudoalteromonas sp. NEC-BIFX-2020_002]